MDALDTAAPIVKKSTPKIQKEIENTLFSVQ